MVWNIFYFHPYLGKIPILTIIFQLGWNHQPVNIRSKYGGDLFHIRGWGCNDLLLNRKLESSNGTCVCLCLFVCLLVCLVVGWLFFVVCEFSKQNIRRCQQVTRVSCEFCQTLNDFFQGDKFELWKLVCFWKTRWVKYNYLDVPGS